ncbi:MAG: hypothetical protein FJ399_06635 [Verrucomicrobia bacterium]|nr:hypothetical protein [Verrucomicrobiota bacterium]
MRSDIPPKCKLKPWEKQELLAKADDLIRTFYRPRFVRPPRKNQICNYVVDFSARWHGAYLIFTAKYACPGPNAIAPFFDHNFARIGWFFPQRCNLWARRHNDQWIVITDDLTFGACLAEMRTNSWFQF